MEYDGFERYGGNQRRVEVDAWAQYYEIIANRAVVSAWQEIAFTTRMS